MTDVPMSPKCRLLPGGIIVVGQGKQEIQDTVGSGGKDRDVWEVSPEVPHDDDNDTPYVSLQKLPLVTTVTVAHVVP